MTKFLIYNKSNITTRQYCSRPRRVITLEDKFHSTEFMKREDCRIVFMGTPEFAVETLQTIHQAGYDIVGVVTSVDKMGGRGRKQVLESAVKKYAVLHAIPLLQPKNLKAAEFNQALRAWNPDIIVVVAFRMLPEIVWSMPSIGTINLHASLLPAYRGAAPINWAIIRGESKTGVTTFFIQKEIDTGDLLLQEEVTIENSDTAGALHDKLMQVGASVVLKTLDQVIREEISPQKQNHNKATKAPKIFAEDCRIKWHQPAKAVYNFIRGMSPYPGAWTLLGEKVIKIFDAQIISDSQRLAPGTVATDGKNLWIGTFDHPLSINLLQMEGRKRMKTNDFLNGIKLEDYPEIVDN